MKDNVQPQNYNSGQGGSNAGEPIPAATLPSPDVPANGPPSSPIQPLPSPPDASTGVAPQHGGENWINEVEELFNRTIQNPHDRAEELMALRQRYQQTVLGIQQAGRHE